MAHVNGRRTAPRAGRHGFAITREQHGTTAFIVVTGELDIETAPAFRDQLARERGNGAGVIVADLSNVTFVDSAGLHALIDASDGGDERLRVILSPAVSRLIDLVQLRERLPIIEG